MAITRFDPIRDLFTLQNRMNSIFQDFSRDQSSDNELLSTAGFIPPVDIYEDEHRVVLKLEIPGIPLEALDIRVENNTLTVRGERKFESSEKEENFRRVERRYGSFYRAFTLPPTVNTENIKAEYENGVLRLNLDKRAEAKPKQIKVNAVAAGAPSAATRQVESAKAPQAETAKTA
ncbi:MAG TPA: Hsp20/alpha crystallin family protein [Acidobacteriaceae bacterium]|nr:Hsp20/alpha crystallin family protein [Acidobacteriaceae bacterium]